MEYMEYILYNKINIKCYTNDYISSIIYKYKCWEPNITLFFNYLLKNKKDNIIFDIGCNIGYFSLISSQYCKKIYAFDANIENINLLNESIQINKINNINTYNYAINDNNNDIFKLKIIN